MIVAQTVLALVLAWMLAPIMAKVVFVIDPFKFITPTGFIGSNSTSGTANTCNLPAGILPGDFAVVFAVTSTSAITVPAGWTTIHNDTVAGAPTALGYRVIQVGDTTTGTWTNAQRLIVNVYRNGFLRQSSVIGGNSSGASTIVGMSSGSTVVGFDWVNAATIKGSSVTGYTTRSSGNPENTLWSGDGPPPTSNQTLSSGLWRSYTITLSNSPALNPLSGGQQFEDDTYWYCAITATGSGTLTVARALVIDELLIGGGGGGGTGGGGGGGAGEAVVFTGVSVTSTRSVSVDTGGAGSAAGAQGDGTDGGSTTAGSNTAHGGGAGSGGQAPGTAPGHNATGSGGGAGGRNNSSGGTSSGVGNAGGHSYTPNTAGSGRGGGGGGYASAGTNGDSVPNGGTGTTAFAAWMPATYAGASGAVAGGGGGGARATPGGATATGGSSVGGAGGAQTNGQGGDGVPNSGSGGGGSAWNGTAGSEPRGGNGGSGLYVARAIK